MGEQMMHRRKDFPLRKTFSCVCDRTAGHLGTGKGDISRPVRAAGPWERRACGCLTTCQASESSKVSAPPPAPRPSSAGGREYTLPLKCFQVEFYFSVTCSRKHLYWSISQPGLDPLAQVGLDPPVTCYPPMLPLPLVTGYVAQGRGSLEPVGPVWGSSFLSLALSPRTGAMPAGPAREMTVSEQNEREPLDCDS